MASVAEIDRCLQSFFSGRMAFDKLVIALKSLRAEGDPHGAIPERLQYWVDLGRLPIDLKNLLVGEIGSSPAESTADILDQPTVPRAPRTGAITPAMPTPPPAPTPPSAPMMALPRQDPLRDKVDEVVVNALIGGFTSLRGARRESGARQDAALDASLADFRSLRFRRDASNAEAGRARTFELDPRQQSRAVGTGAMLKDRFILDSEIGRGGMGVVYRAVDRRRLEAMHRQPYVAVKLLSGDFRHHPEALRTLEAEARKAQELAHPNIVTVHDFERDGSHLFIVMELLEGQPLDKLLSEHAGAPLPRNEAEAVIRGLCAGLGHAHERGVIHADMKPANIFVGAKQEVKLLDFGIASATRGGGFDPVSLGGLTLPYASPGMIEGASREPRDDVYGLGCVVYVILTGQHPFAMRTAVEAREQKLSPQRPAGLSETAWSALAASLAFDPAQRPTDARAFEQAFFASAPFSA